MDALKNLLEAPERASLPEGAPAPQSELRGRVALVLSGATGVGIGIAQHLASAGADIALTYAASEEKAKEHLRALQSLNMGRAIAVSMIPVTPGVWNV
jgi:hypothetical protein